MMGNNPFFPAAPPAAVQQQQQQQQQQSPSQLLLQQPIINHHGGGGGGGHNVNTTVPMQNNIAPPTTTTTAAVAASSMHQQQQQMMMMMPQRSRPCVRCGYPGCDVMITSCRCCLHARCAPIPIRTCPNPRCIHPRNNPPQMMNYNNNNNNGTTTNNSGSSNTTPASHPLELLPMEFDELDESRRVATLTEAASRRAKEKQRARKKAKLESTVMGGITTSQQQNSPSAVTLSTANSSITSTTTTTTGSNNGSSGAGQQLFPDDTSIDSQSQQQQQQHNQPRPTPDNQMSMSSNHHSSSSASSSSSIVVGLQDPLLLSSTALTATAPIGGISPELRTGRWTAEETHYCDVLVSKFMSGRLPLPDGIKLNEFLSSMLKSKQSRLTKKMKNAKLSSKTFRCTTGYLTSELEAREYSEAEDAFFHSMLNQLERCEMRFHTRKEWRETFSAYCVSHGQFLNADAWLVSIDEMDRRVHRAKDQMRMERRKMMMGHALRHDLKNPNRGVVIDKANNNDHPDGIPSSRSSSSSSVMGIVGQGSSSYNGNNNNNNNDQYSSYSINNDPMTTDSAAAAGVHQCEQDQQRARARSLSFALDGVGQSMASPFLNRIVNFIHRHQIPFEYVDAWVPSFVPDVDGGGDGSQGEGESVASGQQQQQHQSQQPMKQEQDDLNSNNGEQHQQKSKCRLCFAGSIVAKQVIMGSDGVGQHQRVVPFSSDDQFNLAAFGDYSESFSFDVGCGLPGRVYHMGVPTWEQSVQNAPLHHFERVGGSQQWGIRTVVGIPVPSPNVGRVVVVLYSRHDRPKDHEMVIRLTDEFTRLLPSPKWKLIVDVGQQQQQVVQQEQQQVVQQEQQQQEVPAAAPPIPSEDPATLSSEVISIFGEHMPSDHNSPAFAYLQGFMSLRLLLLRQNRAGQEQDLVNTMLSSYSSYKAGGRTPADIALMLARDFMFLSQQQSHQQQQSFVSSPQFQPMQYQQQPVQNGMHLSASPQHQHVPSPNNNGASMPPPSYHGPTSQLMQPQSGHHLPQQEQDQFQHNFQDALVNGGAESNMMIGDVAPTPISEMITAAAAAAVSAAAADGGLVDHTASLAS